MKDFPNAWTLVNDLIFGLNFILYTPFSPENECDPINFLKQSIPGESHMSILPVSFWPEGQKPKFFIFPHPTC